MDLQTIAFYDRQAADFAARYAAAPSPVEPYLPMAFSAGCRVLDVGAGSGRDLAAMLSAGYEGFGVEPSSGLREAAFAAHPELEGRLVEGALPDLGLPFGGEFDGIVCCSVLMHLPEPELFDAALAIRRLLIPHGRLLVSIPTARSDVGQDYRDTHGRLFQPYVPEELQLLFERLGFQQIGRWETPDVLRREGIRWSTLLLELRTGVGVRAVDQIEAILNRDRKVATYKFALFRALAEMATQEPRSARWMPEGRVAVPIQRIAERWMLYYWPVFASERFVPQSQAEGAGNDAQPLAFRAPLTALVNLFSGQGIHGGLSTWHLAKNAGRLTTQAVELERAALRAIENAIRHGPVRHAGTALNGGRVFEYEPQGRAVSMSAELWRELSLLGHWIVDAVMLRWAALTERFAYRQGIRSGDVLPLLLARPEPERATEQARAAYLKAGLGQCVWSARAIGTRAFAVDHVIPFALWGNNDLWNLVPTHPAMNSQKSDKLPTAALLSERREPVIESWCLLRDAMPDAFDRQAFLLLGSDPGPGEAWRQTLFARMRQAIEETALQRGVERWAPQAALPHAVV